MVNTSGNFLRAILSQRTQTSTKEGLNLPVTLDQVFPIIKIVFFGQRTISLSRRVGLINY